MALSLFSPAQCAFHAPVAALPTRAPVASMGPAALEELATKLNPAIGYFDPLGLGTADFWSQGNDATVGFLRHAEIKHGRVAMAAFVGYIVQSSGVHFGFDLDGAGNAAYAEGLSPPEQWDAVTPQGKFQILVFIGFLEFWSELGSSLGDGHYMKGGKPGAYPEFPEKNVIPFTPLGIPSLYDPAGFSKNRSPEAKERGLLCEINNGRAAMIGIMSFLVEQKIPGAVPWGPHLKVYAGEVMAPLM